MSEHEQRPAEEEEVERDETVDDLDVPDEQQEGVEGGAFKQARPDKW